MDERQVSLLLVEDDEEDKFLTVEALRDISGTDYEITWVTSAEAAVRELATHRFDVALLDYRLGAHTGIEVLQSSDGDTPCILLTGQRDRDTDLEAMRAGAADYIVKADLGSVDLERSIRYAIDRADDVRSLRDSELRFRAVVEAATDAIMLVNDAGDLIAWNQAALALFGLSEAGAGTANLLDLVGPIGVRPSSPEELSGHTDLRGRTVEQRSFPVEVTISGWHRDQARLWSAIVRDVTWQREIEAQLVHQAFHDPLTNLANRALFADRVEHAITRSNAQPGCIAVLFLDLDDFKRINDSFGHEVGDELLLAVSTRLLACLRPNDTAARLGGDEFGILIEQSADAVVAFSTAQAILESLSAEINISGRSLAMSCSLGIAFTSERSTTYSDLLRDADLAMYAAKSNGKNCFQLFDDSMHAAIMERLNVEVELRSAIENQQIQAFYQPIIDLKTGQIKGTEALARWRHPQRGLLSPIAFIEAAEANGAIVSIGQQIMHAACAQTKRWQDLSPGHRDLTISVNVSARQFRDPLLVEYIEQVLHETGLRPASLIVEITESLLLDRAGLAIEHLRRLALLGVGLAIDDFGTGYSSLSYLQDLPLTLLKVDRSFVNRSHDQRGASLVQAIIAIGDRLGLMTTAEGIETEEQAQFVTQLGCQFGQGYLFAKPMPADDLAALLGCTANSLVS